MSPPNWFRLFPDEDFRWSLSLRSGDAIDFFSSSEEEKATLSLRKEAISSSPEKYVVLPASSTDLVTEMLEGISQWTGRLFVDGREAGSELEPDWVLLRPDPEGRFRVEAGVVCFPSHWSLPEKAGLTIDEVHAPVPGLNEVIGRQISVFLSKLSPAAAWERENWGLSADATLDHHPERSLLRLSGAESLDDVWLRLERQLFVRLPAGGLLFGIRVSNHRLLELTNAEIGLAARMARALRTMSEEAARYKGVSQVRMRLAELLGGNVFKQPLP